MNVFAVSKSTFAKGALQDDQCLISVGESLVALLYYIADHYKLIRWQWMQNAK